MATIKDVARVAGVAPSTVSRVLAGSNRISPETHARVRSAMRDLQYYPNAIARSLARRSTGTLGVIIARPAEQAFANPFFPEAIRGIGSALDERGYSMLLATTVTAGDARAACMRMLQQRRVDGVILTSSSLQDRLIEELAAAAFPYVIIGRAPGTVSATWVNNDNVAVGATAVDHLLSRGHRRIGLINGPRDLMVCLDRRQGYVQALQRAAISPLPDWEVVGAFTRAGGYEAMGQLSRLPEPPTAVFCADDVMAVGALQYLKEHGNERQVALVGVNDDPLTAYIDPPLSTVRIPVFDLGATAASLLVEALQVGSAAAPRQVILPSQLVVRASSDWTVS